MHLYGPAPSPLTWWTVIIIWRESANAWGIEMKNTYLSTSWDLGKSATAHRHDLSSSSLNGVGTSTEGLTAGSGSSATEASSILLEGVAASAVTRSSGDNTNGWSLTASITSGADDGCVASHERRRSQKAESNNGRLCEVHTEPVRWIIKVKRVKGLLKNGSEVVITVVAGLGTWVLMFFFGRDVVSLYTASRASS
jgi:hypothetical protein